MRGSSLTETHLLRVNIGFHSVNLVAKFSCEVVLGLRTHDNKLICQTVARPLVQGRCEINQQLQLEWQSVYDVGKSEYLQTSMEITVLVNSINGTIQAGLCVVDVTRIMAHSNLPLRKCSDKSAFLCVSNSFEFLQVVQEKEWLESSKESFPSSGSVKHKLNKMKSMEFLPRNEDSNLSISKITVSNKKLEGYLRGENEQLQRQVEIVEGKLKLAERKEREILQQLKQSYAKCEKLSIRLLEQASSHEDSLASLQEKDKTIKALQSDLKKSQARVKELVDQEANNERKFEVKDQAAQEQIRRLTEKIANLHSQLRESTQNQNNLLAKYEQIEKNSQLLIKDREKSLIHEKNKLAKENSELEGSVKAYQAQLKDLKEKIAENQYVHEKQKEKLQFQAIVKEKDSQLDAVRQENSRLKQELKEKLTELEELSQANESKQSIRRRMNELQSENNNLKIQLQKASQLSIFNESKLKQMSERCEQLRTELKRCQAKHQQEHSSKLTVISKLHQSEKEVQYYRESYQKLAEMLNQTKEMKDQLQGRLKDQLNEWTKSFEIVSAHNAKLEAENTDLRWELQRQYNRLKENEVITSTFKADLFELKQQLLLKNQKYGQFESKRQQLEESIRRLERDLENGQNRIKDLVKSNSERAALVAAVNKEKQVVLEELLAVKQQHHGYIDQIKSERLSSDRKLQELEKTIESKDIELTMLQQQLKNSNQTIEALKAEIQAKTHDIQEIIHQNQILSEQNVKLSCDLTHKNSDLKALRTEANVLLEEANKLKQEINNITEKHEALQTSFESYKMRNGDAARWILCVLGEQQLIVDRQTVFFPEENLRQLEVEAIKNRNLFLAKLKQSLKAITEEKQFITFELEKIGQQLIDSSNDYQQIIERQRVERQMEFKEYLTERTNLISEIQAQKLIISELKSSNDLYFKQNRLFEHQISELGEQKSQLMSQRQELQFRIQQIQQQNTQKSEKLISSQKQIEQNMMMLAEERNIYNFEESKEKKRYEQQIEILNAKIKQRQEQILVKSDKIRAVQERIIVIQNEKRKVQFRLTVVEHLTKENEAKSAQSQRLREQLTLRIKQVELEAVQQQKQMLNKQITIAHLTNQCNQETQKYAELMVEYQALSVKNIKIEAELHSKAQQLKDSRSKAKEAEDCYSKNRQKLQKEISRLKGELDICVMLNQKFTHQMEEQAVQIKCLQEDIEAKREHINKLEGDNEMIHKEVFFEQNHKSSLERQFEELTENFEHAKSDIYLLEEEKIKLQKEIESLNETIIENEEKLEKQLQNSRLRVVREVAELKKKIEVEENKVLKLDSKCADLQYQIKELQSTIDKKQFLLLASQQQKQKIRCDFEQEFEKLNKKIERLQDRNEEAFSEYRQQREELIRQIQNLNHECTQYSELIRKKEEELEDNHKEHDSSLRKIAILESEMKDLQIENRSKEKKSSKSLQYIMDETDQNPTKSNLNQYIYH